MPRAAFEKRHDDPRRDYGIGCAILKFALVGPRGAVSFDVFTGWYLPHVRERLRRETRHRDGHTCSLEGHGGAMYTHHPPDDRPRYLADQPPTECDLLPGGRCIGDVGYLIGDSLFDTLVEGGQQALASAMLQIYHDSLYTEAE